MRNRTHTERVEGGERRNRDPDIIKTWSLMHIPIYTHPELSNLWPQGKEVRRNEDRGRKQQGRERERKEMKERKRWGCRKVRGIMRGKKKKQKN